MCLSTRRARLPRQDRSSCSPGVGGKGGGVRETTHPSSWASSNGFADFCQHGMGRRRRAVKISHPAPLAKNWSQRGGACRITEAGSFAGDASEMPHAQSGEGDAVFPRRRGPKTLSGAMDRAVLDEQVPPRGWYLLRRASASTDPTGPGRQTHGARRLELRVRASSMQRQEMRNRARDVTEREPLSLFRCHHTSDSVPPPRRWGPGWAPKHWNVPGLARRCGFLAHPLLHCRYTVKLQGNAPFPRIS